MGTLFFLFGIFFIFILPILGLVFIFKKILDSLRERDPRKFFRALIIFIIAVLVGFFVILKPLLYDEGANIGLGFILVFWLLCCPFLIIVGSILKFKKIRNKPPKKS